MGFEIKKPVMPKKTFILGRTLHLDANNKVVEEDDVAGVRVLGTEGKAFYEEEAASYGLDDSHRLVVPEPVPEAAPAEEPAAETAPEELKGHLPEDFPGYAALAEAGINTYGQLRKIEDRTSIPGIGPATDEKIAEALGAAPEE